MKTVFITILICLPSLFGGTVLAQCNPVSSFSEDFESAANFDYFPSCWDRSNTDMQVTNGAGQEGGASSKALQFYNIDQVYDLVSPEILDISSNIFSFYFKSSAVSRNVEIYLSISPLPDQSDKYVVTNFTSGINVWEQIYIDLSSIGLIQSEYDYIHVKVQGSTSSTIYFDKFLMTNRAPTDIFLTNNIIEENQPSGTLLGTFNTTDPDTGDNHSYSLSGADASSFQIDSDQLKSNVIFDFETKNSYEITVTSNDGNGNTFDKNFTVGITNDICDEPISSLEENFDNFQTTSSNLPDCWQRSFPATAETADKAVNLVVGELAMIYNLGDASNRISVVLPLIENLNAKEFSFSARNRQSNQNNEISVFTSEVAFSSNRTLVGNITINSINASNNSYDFSTLDIPESHQYIQIQLSTNTTEIRLDNFVLSEPNLAPTDITLSETSLDENNAIGDVVGNLSSADVNASDIHTYSFVAGDGDLDNSSFTISGNEIQAASVFNYETQSSFSVKIKTEDGKGGTFEKVFNLTINDINDEPLDINLSSAEITEGNAIGDVITTISTEDEDAGDSHSYTLVAGTGDTDNSSFSISGSQLVAQEVFDTNSKTNYSIRIESTDALGLAIEKEFSLTVIADNEAPVGLSLSPGSIDENNAIGDVIGTFTSNDPNPNDTHTYSLVSGNGDTDNSSFTISGDQLLAAEVFDYELKSSYAIRVQTDDGNGGILEGPMSITINDVSENAAPSFVELTSLTTSEADPIGTEVAQFITTDPDPNDMHTYSLSGDDAAAFSVSGNLLTTAIEFDHETKANYTFDVTTTDQAGESFTSSQTINILDANDDPTDLALSENTVDENLDIGTAIGIFSTADQDVNDSHSYSLVSDTGDDDNASFSIVGNELQTAEIFDFEVQAVYSISVQTDDGNEGRLVSSFTISINNIEENTDPTAIELDNISIEENNDLDAQIGTFSTTDADETDTHTYSLVAGDGDSDNERFSIMGNSLFASEIFDFESQSSYSIRVQTDDGNGGQFQQSFTINIIDVEEAVLSIQDQMKNFNIYPNPAHKVLHFSTTHNLRHVKILTAEGVFVRDFEAIQLDKPISTQNISDGLYLLQIQMQNGQILTKRLIISH